MHKVKVKLKQIYIWICPGCKLDIEELCRPDIGEKLICPNCRTEAITKEIVEETYVK